MSLDGRLIAFVGVFLLAILVGFAIFIVGAWEQYDPHLDPCAGTIMMVLGGIIVMIFVVGFIVIGCCCSSVLKEKLEKKPVSV